LATQKLTFQPIEIIRR